MILRTAENSYLRTKMKRMRVKTTIMISAVAVVVAACAGFAAAYISFYGPAVKQEQHIYIKHGMTFGDVKQLLGDNIRHRRAYEFYARHIGLDNSCKAGHYVLAEGMSAVEVARLFKTGRQTPVNVVINNVRTPRELAGKLSRQLEADSVSLLRAFSCDSLARTAGFDTVSLFSMFIPDTYELYWTVTPPELLKRMRREYDAFWSSRDAYLGRCRMSRYEVMTLASILYEETKAVDEMPRIAGVYVNRLRKGMPLQACPTVKYALQDFSLRRILNEHLKVKSPYNTYINKGLPPSPICMPSKQAIDAVLHYEEHPYLFFCARPERDGHHNFARTYAEHNANSRAYSRAVWGAKNK